MRIERDGDLLRFWPEWAGVRLVDGRVEIVGYDPPKYPPPEAHLCRMKPYRQTDGGILVAADDLDYFEIKPEGENIQIVELYGIWGQGEA